MESFNKSSPEISPGRLISCFMAGILFLLLGIQVLFPKLPVPILGIIVSAVSMVDFVAHEMGHVVFGFFGDFISVLGGTLAQLFIPLICLILTFRRRQWFSLSIFIFWVGQSLIQISTYVRDARSQTLRLFSPGSVFGGTSPIHDWHYLLDKTGLLWADQFLGWSIFSLGLVMLLLAAGIMFARGVGYLQKSENKLP
jgi:hypothetical protein